MFTGEKSGYSPRGDLPGMVEHLCPLLWPSNQLVKAKDLSPPLPFPVPQNYPSSGISRLVEQLESFRGDS